MPKPSLDGEGNGRHMSKAIFRTTSEGIPQYQGDTDVETTQTEWSKLDYKIDEQAWKQAAIAYAVKVSEQADAVKAFAEKVGRTPGYVYKLSRTYKYYAVDRHCPRVHSLHLKHHTLALRYPHPHAALLYARENALTCVRFEEWIINEINSGKASRRAGMSDIERSELREFCEKAEEIFQQQLIQPCPNKEWGKRVFGAMLNDLREENRQLYIADVRELVRDTVEKRSRRTVAQIVQATGLKKHEVESAAVWLIEENEYEWREQRGETDEARGTHTLMLFRRNEPYGNSFTPSRSRNNNEYVH